MINFLDTLKLNELNDYQKNKRNWLMETDYSEQSIKTFWRMLNSNVLFREKSKERDLYDFSKPEIVDIIKTMPTINVKSKYSMFSIINSYIKWACKRGYNYVGNPCDTILPTEIIEVNQDAVKQSYSTLTKFYDFIDSLICSDVDKMILVLLRYGVKIGVIPTLRWIDVDEENMTLRIYSEKYDLNYPIDVRFLDRFNKCLECEVFSYKAEGIDINTTYSDAGYIIKNTNRSDGATLNINSLYNRVNTISRNNKIPRIKSGHLNKSRKYDFLFQAYRKFGEVDAEDIRVVTEKFDGNTTATKVSDLKNNFELISNVNVKIINYGMDVIHKVTREKKDLFN